VVFGAVLLCADGTGRFLHFAELSVVAVTLTVTAVGVRGPREVFCNSAYAVSDSKTGCTKTCQVNGAMEGDDDGGGVFVEVALSWDKPAGFLHESQGWVSSFNFTSDTVQGSIGGDIVDEEFSPAAVQLSGGRIEGFNFMEEHRHVWGICGCRGCGVGHQH
jgi:hypothetical protein